MRRYLTTAAVSMLVAAAWPCHADEATARRELAASLSRQEALFRQSFSLPVTSPEVNALLSAEIARNTQAIGMPMQLTISHFTYDHAPAQSRIALHLANLAPAQAEFMERQANQMIQGSGIDDALKLVALDAFKEGLAFLSARQGASQLRNETPAVADFSVDGGQQELMPGLTLSEVWFRFERQVKAITAIQFRFSNGRKLMARMRYTEAALPGGGTVPVPAAAEITQDAMTAPQDGVTIPPKVTLRYGTCTFRRMPPAAPAP